MEELALMTALALLAVPCIIGVLVADLMAFMLGLGWGYFSKSLRKRWRAYRARND
jgi:hypothetical protein